MNEKVRNRSEEVSMNCTAFTYCTIQNFGGRKFWQNGSQQRLANKILTNEQNTITHKIFERENFGEMAHGKDWWIKYT